MEITKPRSQKLGLTTKILIAMGLGIPIGLLLFKLPETHPVHEILVEGVLDTGGKLFLTILKMLVVPIVFISLVGGTCKLGSTKKFGRLALKTFTLYILTTALAISLALTFASLFHVGSGSELTATADFTTQALPSLKQTFLSIVPSNPIAALAAGNMLQIIVFAILMGLAITWSGEAGERIAAIFQDLDVVVMRLMTFVLNIAPYGVFCLVTTIFAKIGFKLIHELIGYFFTVLLVLFIQLLVIYPTLLKGIAKLNPVPFFKKLFPAMMFAFSTSSSTASIPVVMETVEVKLGVNNFIASFVIPLGATINMDGTAIMQGVATVFIANAYQIPIGFTGYLLVVLTATLASIGTAGVPSVGLVTLTMVLQQVGLPIEGIALILGVDRLLDMTRTAVNITGDSAIACIVGKSEQGLDETTYKKENITFPQLQA